MPEISPQSPYCENEIMGTIYFPVVVQAVPAPDKISIPLGNKIDQR